MPSDDAIQPVEHFREYLLVLARLQSDLLNQARLDPSDLVQMTLLKAYQNRTQFRGQTGREQAAWMRKILSNTMIDAVRRARPGMEFRERSLEAALDQSSQRLEALLCDHHPSPSEAEARHDRLVGLAGAIGKLPDDQRLAIELRYLQGLSIAEISGRMERSAASVGGLLQRALRGLRERLGAE